MTHSCRHIRTFAYHKPTHACTNTHTKYTYMSLVRPSVRDDDHDITVLSHVGDVSVWADKANPGTKGSVAVRTWKGNNNRRACFRSTGFAEQSLFFRIAYPGLFFDLSPVRIRLRQAPRSVAMFSQDSLLISKIFRED